MPFPPNAAQGRPSRASSANSCDCAVATNIRRRQAAPVEADSSSQVETPRLAKSPYLTVRSIFGSNTQRSRPVAGSSAITRPSGVPRYIVASATSGVASKAGAFWVLKRGSVSPVRYVHATSSRLTFFRVISDAGLYRVPCASRPLALQSTACARREAGPIPNSSAVTSTRIPSSPNEFASGSISRRGSAHECYTALDPAPAGPGHCGMTATHSFVLEHPPAEPAAAERHFLAKLAVETDPADVHLDLERGHPGIVVVDTRSPAAYALCHVPGAINLPTRTISLETSASLPRDKVIVTYCWGPGCNGSTRAAAKLAALGFRVKEMIGGIGYWRKEGLPVEGSSPGDAPLYA